MKNIEIARKLQISPAAVSLALNNKAGVSEETRRKVLAVKESSLIMDAEQTEVIKKQSSLGIFCYQMDHSILVENQFFGSILSYLSMEADQNGYYLNVKISNEKSLVEQISEMNRSGCSGYFIFASKLNDKDAQMINDNLYVPYVLIDAYFAQNGVDCVLPDNRSGLRQSLEYAVSMGHKEIGFIGSDFYCSNFRDRKFYFRQYMREFGLVYKEEYMYSLRMDDDAAKEDMLNILESSRNLPTLLIASNDILAMGAMNAIKEYGYHIPDDISIIGFDDLPVSRHMTPPLTTVAIEADAISYNAVKLLLEKIKMIEKRKFSSTVLIGVELIKRGSVKKF